MKNTIKINALQNGYKSVDRVEHIEKLIKIIESMFLGVFEHYRKNGLQYVEVPEVVGITGACESIDTLFKVSNRLDLPLFITQTGQLSLEQSLQIFPGVFTVIHSGRDEEKEDERHLRQFRLTEEEFDCTLAGMDRDTYDEEKMYEALLKHIEKAIKAIVKRVYADCGPEIEKTYGRTREFFEETLFLPFLRIDYQKAITILNKNGFPRLKFGDDLKAVHEQMMVKLVNQDSKKKAKIDLPVFIMRYPKEIKFFNMKVSKNDPRVVLSADLIFPISGEGVGSAVREHEGRLLKERLLSSTMYRLHHERGGEYRDFAWYVDEIIGKGKTNPHAGYGIGNERVLQFILGQKDIRMCSLFSLLDMQTHDWDVKRRGKIYLFSSKRKILLTIGRSENKRKLLPFIKKVYGKKVALYATKKTHFFLKKKGIETMMVYKISQQGKPNLGDLLEQNIFDVIINIPSRDGTEELTDGKLIRKAAIESGTTLITDMEVATEFLNKFSQRENV